MSEPPRTRGIVTVDGTVCGDLYRIAGRRFAQFIEDFSRSPVAPESFSLDAREPEGRAGWDRAPWDEPDVQ